MSTIVVITAGHWYAKPSALKPTLSASQHRSYRPLGSRCVCLCNARIYLPPAISNSLLFIKTPADYIISKLLDSTLVNFSQAEHSVGTRLNFQVKWDSLQFYDNCSCVNFVIYPKMTSSTLRFKKSDENFYFPSLNGIFFGMKKIKIFIGSRCSLKQLRKRAPEKL